MMEKRKRIMVGDQLYASSSKEIKSINQFAHQRPQISHEDTAFIPETSTSDDNTRSDEALCINSVLPDEILEEILAKLSITSIPRVGSICKKWKKIAQSTTFAKKFLDSSSHKPWYLMLAHYPVLTHHHCDHDHVYDNALGTWRCLEIPFKINPFSPTASSSGLVCFMLTYESREVYVYNPITKLYQRHVNCPANPPGFANFSALSISVGRDMRSYTVAIIRAIYRDLFEDCQLAIDVYNSEKQSWETREDVTLHGWGPGFNCVICDEVLYFVVKRTSQQDPEWSSGALYAYDLVSGSLDPSSFLEGTIPLPSSLGRVQLMSMKGKVVLVGGVRDLGSWVPALKGIRIWLLEGKEWIEMARMPEEYYKEFDVFLESSGFDETIYIQDNENGALVMFDMGSRQWRWAQKSPVVNQDDLTHFSGICFEPRFDTVP